MTDYYSVLSRAVASLSPNTAQARAQLFERARRMLRDRMRDGGSGWTQAEAATEIANLDAAIERIEEEQSWLAAHERPGRPRLDRGARPTVALPRGVAATPSQHNMGWLAVFGAAGVAAVLLIGVAIYAFRGGPAEPPKPSGGTAVTAASEAPKEAPKTVVSRAVVDVDDLEPGIDGAGDSNLAYYLRRQVVYYRSVYSAGMIVVDRSQRFLYLLQPQSRALRYGIGVGGECEIGAGLYRIESKAEWPEWSPTAALLKQHKYPAHLAGGPGNPLGAYAMYFKDNNPGIHGTNAPKSIGRALLIGCLRLLNEDVVDLEKRVAVGTSVVVLN